MALAARIAARHPEVGAAERARYQVVLLDEYQDTSHAQLRPAAGPVRRRAPGDRRRRPLPVDLRLARRQRGQPSPLHHGTSRARRPGAQPRSALLSTSFRNTGAGAGRGRRPAGPLRADAPEVPRLVAPPGRAGRGQVACALLETAADEADWIADRIAGLLSAAARHRPGRRARGRTAATTPLHRRRHRGPLPQAVPVPGAARARWRARGIPVEVVGLGGLLTVPEVADIVATLRVMHDPAAADALARLLTGPRWRIGPRDLVALGAAGPERPAERNRPVRQPGRR